MWLLNNAECKGLLKKLTKCSSRSSIIYQNRITSLFYISTQCLISKLMEEIAIFYTKKSLLKMRTHIYLCVVILRLVRRFSIPCGARRWRFARGSLSVLFLLACEPRAKAFKHVNGKSLRRWPFHKENRRKYGYLLTDCLATKSYFRKS